MPCVCIVLLMTLVSYVNEHICYSTCDSVQSIKRMVNSDDVQERNSSVLKPCAAHCCIIEHRSMSDVNDRSIHRKPAIWQSCNGPHLSEMFVTGR